MQRILGLLALSAFTASTAAAQAIHTVDVDDNFFSPQDITIIEGDTIEWDWVGLNNHSTTANGGQTEFWDSGVVGAPNTFQYTFTTASGLTDYFCTPHVGLGMTGTVDSIPWSGVSINEVLADPDTLIGDANCDGVVSSTQDEFIEIVNTTGSPIDISDWTISDNFTVRHTFPAYTVLDPGNAVLVFGGGTPLFDGSSPSVEPWCVTLPPAIIIQTAGTLGLNNNGDTIVLADSFGVPMDTFGYGAEGGNDNSLRHVVETQRGLIDEHLTLAGTPWSPGTDSVGVPWGPAPGPQLFAPVPGVAGVLNSFDVVGGPSSDTIFYIRSGSAGAAPIPPCPGLNSGLGSITVLANGVTDANGNHTLNQYIPAPASGVAPFIQAVFPNTCEITNVINPTF